jgi:DNA polymerase III subunit delta
MAQRSGNRSTAHSSTPRTVIAQLAWNEIRPAPVVLVTGSEAFLAERSVRRLRDFLRGEDPALEVTEIDADGYAAGELSTLASPSLFGEARLVVVSSVEKCSDAFLADTVDYLSAPADGATLVLRHGGGMRGKKLLDAIRAGDGGGIEVVCSELKKDSERYDFVVAEFRAAGRRATPSAVRALVSAFTGDLAELSAACRQLMADAGDEITEASVATYYGGRVETTAFAVADAAIAGRRGEALVALRQALASGADPVPLVAAFAMKVRTMAKVAGTRGTAARLAGPLGLAPWQIDRARRDLAGWDDRGIASAIESLAETDADVKGGGRDPVFALERLVGVIAGRGRLA